MLGAAGVIAIVGEEGGCGAPEVTLPLPVATNTAGGRRLRKKCANRKKKKHNSSSATTSPIHQYETGSGGSPALVLTMTIVQLAQLKAQASAITGLSHAAVTLANVSHRPPAPTGPHCWINNRSLSVSSLSTNAEQGVGEVVGREEGGAEGLTVGLAVGEVVGVMVGSIVGKVVGPIVGKVVGPAVGDTVGAAVGHAIGSQRSGSAALATKVWPR